MTTINDIAANLGITAATVSRALNEKPGVGAGLRATIREEAARLNFVANSTAQSLRTARTMTAAMTVARLTSTDHLAAEPFYGPIMLGIEQELEQHGYHLLVSTLTDAHLEQPERWSILRGRVDGVIVVGPSVPVRFLRVLRKRGMAVVLVDNAVEDPAIDTVLPEDRLGARELAKHMIAHGHRRIAILSGPDAWVTNHERCAGFSEALKTAGIEPLAILYAAQTTERTGYQLLREVLSVKPTAVLAINDRMAMGAIDAAKAACLAVPTDLAITGFDDLAPVARINPPLTTVHIPTEEIGRGAASLLLRRIARPGAPRQRSLVATSLAVRRSCGCEEKPSRPYLPPQENTIPDKSRQAW